MSDLNQSPQDPQVVTAPEPVNAHVPFGDVLILAEQLEGQLQPVALELLGAGRRLADTLGLHRLRSPWQH